ncbi:MAG: protein TolR [Desulfovibrionales bacterium]|nr:protein TolR [Desulfovibrionales bacterium]
MELGGNDKKLLSEINVTPFVDVMLVLLIIFMVTAPMMIQGMDVELPKTTARAIDNKEENIVITIDRHKDIFVNNARIPQPQIKKYMQHLKETATGREVLLRADRSVPYGLVVEIMAQIRAAGIEKLGMVTEPLEEKR